MQRTLKPYQNRFLLALALAAAAVTVTLAARAPRAHAEHEIPVIIAGVSAAIAFPVIGVPGIVTAVHNGMYRNELTSGWRAAGYVFGTANLLAGVVLPAIGTSGRSCDSACVGANLAWTIPTLVNGVVNLTFSALGKSPSMDTRLGKLSVVPVTGVGAQNKVFGGVGLQLASF